MPDSTPADREPAKSDAQAKARFLDHLNKSLSCVSKQAHWLVMPDVTGAQLSAVTVPSLVLALKTQDGDRVFLRSTLGFEYTDDARHGGGERKVSTKEYAHTVGRSESLKPQMYSWEWSETEPRYPHVHVRRSDPDFHGLGDLHIPTGRVYFESVLYFLIQEHGVITQRDDWAEVLGESFRRVSKYSSWGGGQGDLDA